MRDQIIAWAIANKMRTVAVVGISMFMVGMNVAVANGSTLSALDIISATLMIQGINVCLVGLIIAAPFN